ncbi:hypothetical protein A3H53_02525 [Candidatus Nomurabacteria bacterium RIFCSPLOWO2_02_FULL_40_10]|uniref:Nitroreductase domain-containing protein n=2 Tax=Candidatus Nomuraibacteriota TaxID=1752729 RepID=A0A1F6Y0I2_9BACT|nr:MAG: hypothetical protein A2642_00055 [Candidatus Nomurabacteria bacterium RIFCSPHIGHO2_01_FULL_39_10]OGI99880.1 MAG: hypothetical protein A3H53_02525 [Candidatus Nomurabacteria bacterium RIFCSPLOWO2_02_FULL_40_10]
MSKTLNNRTTEYDIDDQFLTRHSPRALSGEALSEEELKTLFDAARWAPSASNIQPWRFIYAMRETPEFETMFSFLVDFNKSWCVNASTLVVTISAKTSLSSKGEKRPNPTHSFDTGAAWENLALQANKMNLVAHGMAGFDYKMAKEKLGVPDDYNVEMMFAVGRHGKIENLPEALRKGETPNNRHPLSETVFLGKFPA